MEVSEHNLKKLSKVGFEPPPLDHLYALTAHTYALDRSETQISVGSCASYSVSGEGENTNNEYIVFFETFLKN